MIICSNVNAGIPCELITYSMWTTVLNYIICITAVIIQMFWSQVRFGREADGGVDMLPKTRVYATVATCQPQVSHALKHTLFYQLIHS